MDNANAPAEHESAIEDAARAALDLARQFGADAADTVVTTGTALSTSVRLGVLEETERQESRDLGLRVFVGDAQAIVSTNDLSTTALTGLAERAVAMARIAPPDPHAGLAPKKRLARDWPELDLAGETRPSVEMLEALAREAEDSARAVSGVTNSDGGSASYGESRFVLATSDGFFGGYSSTRYSVSCSAIAGEGTGMQSDYDFSAQRHFDDLRPPGEIGRQAGERAVRRLGPIRPKTGPVTVMFDTRAARSLLGHFSGAINGRAVARGTSFLKDRKGAEVFAKGVTIIDDPLRLRGSASRPFDGEGLACRPMTLIDDGVLTGWLLDCASARQLGLEPQGQARRGVGSSPSPGTSNLTLQPGEKSPEALMREVGKGLFVTSLIGMGVNGVTGDYSRGIDGFMIENGELTTPISEVTIAGNLIDMFAALTPADDLTHETATSAPTVVVEGLTLAGA